MNYEYPNFLQTVDDTSVTLEYMASQRRKLANEQARLEERSRLRSATVGEFEQIRRQRLESCRKAFMHEAIQAKERNRHLLKEVYKTKEKFENLAQTHTRSVLSQQKTRFLTKVESAYPSWQKDAAATAVAKVHELERERVATLHRMQAAQQAFEEEQALKQLLEQTRQGLTMTQLMEHNEEVKRQMRREKLCQQVQQRDEVMFTEAVRAMEAARVDALSSFSKGRNEMEEDIRKALMSGLGVKQSVSAEEYPSGEDYFYRFDFSQLAPERAALEASARAHAQWLKEQVALEAATLAINDPTLLPGTASADQPSNLIAGVTALRGAQAHMEQTKIASQGIWAVPPLQDQTAAGPPIMKPEKPPFASQPCNPPFQYPPQNPYWANPPPPMGFIQPQPQYPGYPQQTPVQPPYWPMPQPSPWEVGASFPPQFQQTPHPDVQNPQIQSLYYPPTISGSVSQPSNIIGLPQAGTGQITNQPVSRDDLNSPSAGVDPRTASISTDNPIQTSSVESPVQMDQAPPSDHSKEAPPPTAQKQQQTLPPVSEDLPALPQKPYVEIKDEMPPVQYIDVSRTDTQPFVQEPAQTKSFEMDSVSVSIDKAPAIVQPQLQEKQPTDDEFNEEESVLPSKIRESLPSPKSQGTKVPETKEISSKEEGKQSDTTSKTAPKKEIKPSPLSKAIKDFEESESEEEVAPAKPLVTSSVDKTSDTSKQGTAKTSILSSILNKTQGGFSDDDDDEFDDDVRSSSFPVKGNTSQKPKPETKKDVLETEKPSPLKIEEDQEEENDVQHLKQTSEKRQPDLMTYSDDEKSVDQPAEIASLVETIKPTEQVQVAKKLTAEILSRAEKSRTERAGYRLGYAKGRNLPVKFKNDVVTACLESQNNKLSLAEEDLMCELYADLLVRRGQDMLPLELLNGKVGDDKIKKHHKKFKKECAGELWDVFSTHIQKLVEGRLLRATDVPKVFVGLFLNSDKISASDIDRYQRKMETFFQKLGTGDSGTPVGTPKSPSTFGSSPLPTALMDPLGSGEVAATSTGRPPLSANRGKGTGLGLAGPAKPPAASGAGIGGGIIMGGAGKKKAKGGLNLGAMGVSAVLQGTGGLDEFEDSFGDDGLESSSFNVSVGQSADKAQDLSMSRSFTSARQPPKKSEVDSDDEFG